MAEAWLDQLYAGAAARERKRPGSRGDLEAKSRKVVEVRVLSIVPWHGCLGPGIPQTANYW